MSDMQTMIPQRVTLKVLVTQHPDTPQEQIVEEEVVIRHLRMSDIDATIAALTPMAHLIKDPKKFDPTKVFMEHRADALQLIAVSLHKHIDWVNQLEIDSAIEVFSRLLEVNLDFFIKKLLPLLLTVVAQLKNAEIVRDTLNGASTSKPSSPTAIDSKTSGTTPSASS